MRGWISILLLGAALIVSTTLFAAKDEVGTVALKNGDLLFQSLDCGPLCEQIEASLQTPYSHLGIVYIDATGIKVIESTKRTQITPLDAWLRQGRGRGADLFRLRSSQQQPGYGEAIVNAAMKFLGRDYDDDWEWSDDKLYCSEMVWKSFFNGLKLRLSSPKDYYDELAKASNALFWQGYFRGAIPHRLGVSPKDLAGSRYLERLGYVKKPAP